MALHFLERAAALGLPDPAIVPADPVFVSLAEDPTFAGRLEAVAGARPFRGDSSLPAPVLNGVARVAAANTVWNPARERLEPRLAFSGKPAAHAVLLPGPKEKEAARDLLREHWRRGRVAATTATSTTTATAATVPSILLSSPSLPMSYIRRPPAAPTSITD